MSIWRLLSSWDGICSNTKLVLGTECKWNTGTLRAGVKSIYELFVSCSCFSQMNFRSKSLPFPAFTTGHNTKITHHCVLSKMVGFGYRCSDTPYKLKARWERVPLESSCCLGCFVVVARFLFVQMCLSVSTISGSWMAMVDMGPFLFLGSPCPDKQWHLNLHAMARWSYRTAA